MIALWVALAAVGYVILASISFGIMKTSNRGASTSEDKFYCSVAWPITLVIVLILALIHYCNVLGQTIGRWLGV